MFKAALFGVGALGKAHLKNLRTLSERRGDFTVAALCDAEGKRASDSALPGENVYADADELFKNEAIDFAVSATPTDVHDAIALNALGRGIHVFSEKPMAISIERCEKMAEAADKNGKLLMIGQCLRYWPEYKKLKEYIDGGVYGKVVRASFSRICAHPTHSWQNWMNDFSKSGGAALDVHVHDVDFINWAFGLPEDVSSRTTSAKQRFESVFTTYGYDDKLVYAESDWGYTGRYPFRALFTVRFEDATVEQGDAGMKVYPQGKDPFVPEIEIRDAYIDEMDDFIGHVVSGRPLEVVTVESVLRTMRIAFAEMESADKKAPVCL